MDPFQAKKLLQLYNDQQLSLDQDNLSYLQRLAHGETNTSQPQTQSAPPPAPASGPMNNEDQQRFNEWYANHANKYKLNQNAYSKEQHYDTEGFYKSMMNAQDESPELHHGHMSSDFKDEDNLRSYLKDSKGRIYNTISGKYLDGSPVLKKELELGEMAPNVKRKKIMAISAQQAQAILNSQSVNPEMEKYLQAIINNETSSSNEAPLAFQAALAPKTDEPIAPRSASRSATVAPSVDYGNENFDMTPADAPQVTASPAPMKTSIDKTSVDKMVDLLHQEKLGDKPSEDKSYYNDAIRPDTSNLPAGTQNIANLALAVPMGTQARDRAQAIQQARLGGPQMVAGPGTGMQKDWETSAGVQPTSVRQLPTTDQYGRPIDRATGTAIAATPPPATTAESSVDKSKLAEPFRNVSPTTASISGYTKPDPYGLSSLLKASQTQHEATQNAFTRAEELTKQSGQQASDAATNSAIQNNRNNIELEIKDTELGGHAVRRQKQAEHALNELNSMSEKLGEYKEDPNHFWNTLPTGTKILGVLGLLLGAGPLILPMLGKAINRDIDAQREAYQAKKNSFAAKNSVYGRMMNKFEDEQSADAASRIMLLDQSARKMQQMALNANIPSVKLKAEAALGQLSQERADEAYKFAMRQYQLTHPGIGSGSNKTEKAAEAYGQDLESSGINKSLAQLDTTINAFSGLSDNMEIPGASLGLGSRIVKGTKDFFSGPGSYNRDTYSSAERKIMQDANSAYLNVQHELSGVATSPTEREDIKNSFEAARTIGDIRAAIANAREIVMRHKAAIAAGHEPKAVALRESRGQAYAPPMKPNLPPPIKKPAE